MPAPSVLILYNLTTLPEDHPDYDSEHSVVEIADAVADVLAKQGMQVRRLGLGDDPTVLWTELTARRPGAVFNLHEGAAGDPETE